jgi:hypothetical protein
MKKRVRGLRPTQETINDIALASPSCPARCRLALLHPSDAPTASPAHSDNSITQHLDFPIDVLKRGLMANEVMWTVSVLHVLTNCDGTEVREVASTSPPPRCDWYMVIRTGWRIRNVVLSRAVGVWAKCEISPTVLISPHIGAMSRVIVQMAIRPKGGMDPFVAVVDGVRAIAAKQAPTPSGTTVTIATPAK